MVRVSWVLYGHLTAGYLPVSRPSVFYWTGSSMIGGSAGVGDLMGFTSVGLTGDLAQVDLEPNETLFRNGEDSESGMFIVVEGSVGVYLQVGCNPCNILPVLAPHVQGSTSNARASSRMQQSSTQLHDAVVSVSRVSHASTRQSCFLGRPEWPSPPCKSGQACIHVSAAVLQEGDDLVHTNTLFPGESVGDLDVLDGMSQQWFPLSQCPLRAEPSQWFFLTHGEVAGVSSRTVA